MQPSLLLQPFFAMPDLILKSVSPLSTAKSVNLPLKAIFLYYLMAGQALRNVLLLSLRFLKKKNNPHTTASPHPPWPLLSKRQIKVPAVANNPYKICKLQKPLLHFRYRRLEQTDNSRQFNFPGIKDDWLWLLNWTHL